MNEVDKNILISSFKYLYWFSRFEYTLKEKKYLMKKSNAEADWEQFITDYKDKYIPCDKYTELINLHPKRQKLDKHNQVIWERVGLDHCSSNNSLCKIITMLKTVRNNLFHGGKHIIGFDTDKKRNLQLLEVSTILIKKIANINDFGKGIFEPYPKIDLENEIFCNKDKNLITEEKKEILRYKRRMRKKEFRRKNGKALAYSGNTTLYTDIKKDNIGDRKEGVFDSQNHTETGLENE